MDVNQRDYHAMDELTQKTHNYNNHENNHLKFMNSFEDEKLDEEEEEEEEGSKLTSLFSHQKKKLLFLSCFSFCFLCFLIILCIILLDDDEWMIDKHPRYLKLVPAPNGPRNTIRFRHGHGEEGDRWPVLVDEMKTFLASYDSKVTLTGLKNISTCEDGTPQEGHVCHWDTDEIRRLCKPTLDFGFPQGSPCIFLQFNKVLNFEVEPYTQNDTQWNPLLTENSLTNYRIGQSYLFLECRGNTIVDVENSGRIYYAPSSQEFPEKYFPYTGHPDYMAPFIAIKFENPKPYVVIGITCRLWAKNLTHSDGSSPAEMPFNLFIE